MLRRKRKFIGSFASVFACASAVSIVSFAAASVNAATYQCLACPPGTYSVAGAQGASSCIICPSGSYCPGGSDKKACPSDYSCPEGTVNLEDQIAKKLPTCPAGSYVLGNACTICPANNYCTGGTKTSPTACPTGTASPAGSTSSSACKAQCTNTQYPTYSQAYTNPRGLVQGYCHTTTLGCSPAWNGSAWVTPPHCDAAQNQGWSGKTWEGSTGGVPGGGQYCFCRTKSYGTNQCGAWSSWVYYFDGVGASGCADYCAGDCAYYVVNWGGAARW